MERHLSNGLPEDTLVLLWQTCRAYPYRPRQLCGGLGHRLGKLRKNRDTLWMHRFTEDSNRCGS